MKKDQTLKSINPMNDYIHLLIWGAAGSGKTVLAHTFPRTRTLDLDYGISSVLWAIRAGIVKKDPEEVIFRRIKEEISTHGFVKRPSALDQCTQTVDEWLEEPNEWDTLIVDSATTLNRFVALKGVSAMDTINWSKTKKDSMLAKVNLMKIQDYGAAKNLFQQFIDWIRSLEKNIVLVCHEYDETNEDGMIRGKYPMLIGTLRQEIAKDFNEVWYANVKGKEAPRYVVQTGKAGLIKVAKTRMGFLPFEIENMTYEKLQAMKKKYYGVK